MKSKTLITSLIALVVYLSASGAFAASASTSGFKPSGINGSAGVGFVTWKVLQPADSNMRFDQGTYAAITGERGFGVLNMYLNLSLSYMQGTGQTNYSYSTLSGETYTASDVNFKTNLFQAGLGLKIKLIDGYWFRPYVEGGGTGGYFTIQYQDLARKATSTPAGGTNYKSEDSLLDFGKYLEGGAEITFSGSFGLRAGARFTESRTKKFATLGDSEIKYKSEIYYLALLAAF